jgi:hypothetical protein
MSTPVEYAPIHDRLSASSRSSSIEDLAQRLQDIIESERAASSPADESLTPVVIRRHAWDIKDNEYPAAPCPTPTTARNPAMGASVAA